MTGVKLDIDRVKRNLETVAGMYNSDKKGYTRLAFSKEEDQAIDWVAKELELYGARVRKDTVGNLYGRIGPDDAPVVAFGSHLDTVQNGGLFDGALGVFIGLECLRVLNDQIYDSNVAYELICFKGEEGNPLGGTFGSRTVMGKISLDKLDDSLLKSLDIAKIDIKNAMNTLPEYKAFIENHVEQGTVLENHDNKTGIVTNIAGISRSHLKIFGTTGHSGTMPMKSRDDALVKASEIVLHIHREAKKLNDGTVATIGQMDASPNLATVIPGMIELTFEVRSGYQDRIDTFERDMLAWITTNYNAEIVHGVKKKSSNLSQDVQARLKKAADTLGLPVMKMVSGANHDANSLTDHTDVGMLFVPSIDGISHNPEESSHWAYINNAAEIMLQTLKLYGEN